MSRHASRVAACVFVLCLALAADATKDAMQDVLTAVDEMSTDECHATSKRIFFTLTKKEAPLAEESLQTSPLIPSVFRRRFIHGGNNLIARFAIQGEAFFKYHCAHEFTIVKFRDDKTPAVSKVDDLNNNNNNNHQQQHGADVNARGQDKMILVQSYANVYYAKDYVTKEQTRSKAQNMFSFGPEGGEFQALGTFQRLLRCLASTQSNPCLSNPLLYVPVDLHGHLNEFCDYFCPKENWVCFKCRAYAALFTRDFERQDGRMKISSMLFGNLVATDENLVGFQVFDAVTGELVAGEDGSKASSSGTYYIPSSEPETPLKVVQKHEETNSVKTVEESKISSRRKSTRSLYRLKSWSLDKNNCLLSFTRIKKKNRESTKYLCVRHLDTTMINDKSSKGNKGDLVSSSSLIWNEKRELYMPDPSGFVVYGEVTTQEGLCSDTEDPVKEFKSSMYYRFESETVEGEEELEQLYSHLAICSG
eukprot:GILJ01000736.1.p1 GENE.GILJ01000736.1~~GILJ01000736.1.p1  ORF type:complete len:477 (+),score=67.69 GILJ01000736.1:42-1472(+)